MNTPEPQRSASKTALGVAIQRMIHQRLDDDPKILIDPIAERLLDGATQQQVLARLQGAREPGIAGLRSHVVLRSRFTEERLEAAVRRGISQFVILGAGLDTFAYRQPKWAQHLRIFEVDHQGTQADKRARLQRAGIALPENLDFVAIDFETTSLRDGLLASRLDFSRPAFFSCLGVLIYLSKDAVDAVFELVAGFPAGSEIAFTYSTPTSAFTDLASKVSALGEPWQSHFDPATWMPDLRARGYSEISVLGIDEAERLYFSKRADGLHAPRRGGIAAAVVGAGAPQPV